MLTSLLEVIVTVLYASRHHNYQVPREIPSLHLLWVIVVVQYDHIPSLGNSDRVVCLAPSQLSSSQRNLEFTFAVGDSSRDI